MSRPRILFVARPYSVHTARWINQIADLGWDLHLFPGSETPLHPDYQNVTAYSFERDPRARPHETVRTRVLWPLPFAGSRVKLLANRLRPTWLDRAQWLARIIRRVKPDLIHALEFQEAGYLIARTKAMFSPGEFPTLMVSNWGSDIQLYGPLPEHTEKVKAVLAAADYYSSECERDVVLAREYGFTGHAFPAVPAAGGFDLENMRQYRQPGPTSARRVVALKGYQHWAGRALAGLRALELCADGLKARGMTVALHSVYNADVRLAAEAAAHRSGLPIELDKSESREDVLRTLGRARVSIGLSISDGLSTSALEGLIMGAFLVQSNTSCLMELLAGQRTALMVPPEDPKEIAEAIMLAVSDDEMVDRATAANDRIVAERLSDQVVRPEVVAMYRTIFERQTNNETNN